MPQTTFELPARRAGMPDSGESATIKPAALEVVQAPGPTPLDSKMLHPVPDSGGPAIYRTRPLRLRNFLDLFTLRQRGSAFSTCLRLERLVFGQAEAILARQLVQLLAQLEPCRKPSMIEGDALELRLSWRNSTAVSLRVAADPEPARRVWPLPVPASC
jgi:hypothetical protein